MKKTLNVIMASAFGLMMFASCQNAEKQTNDKKGVAQAGAAGQVIAYVEIDSIMTQYKFCIENKKVLEQKGQNIQNTIAQKAQALQNAMVKFQQDIQQNKYTQQQAEAVQANLQKQDRDLQALQQRLGTEFQSETDKFNKALRDSVQHFLAEYNKDKKYSYIMSKSGDNMLYADKKFDITEEVIAGLNKAYKSPKGNNSSK